MISNSNSSCADDESKCTREPSNDLFDELGPDFFGSQERYRKIHSQKDTPRDLLQHAQTKLGLIPKDVSRAAEAIALADYLLIGAGAGLGVDSGVCQIFGSVQLRIRN